MLVSGCMCVCMYVWVCSTWLTSHHLSFHLYLDLFLIWPFLLYLWMSLLLPLSLGAKFPRSSWLVVDVVGIAYLLWIFFSFLRSFLNVCLSIGLSVGLCLSFSLCLCPFVCFSLLYLTICLYIYLSGYLYFICIFVSTLSICLFVCVSTLPLLSLSLSLSLPNTRTKYTFSPFFLPTAWFWLRRKKGENDKKIKNKNNE